LSDERNLLRTLTDHLPGPVFVKDTQSRFVTCNAATLRSLGAQSLEEVVGKTDLDFLDRAQVERFFADEQEVFRTGERRRDRGEQMGTAAPRWLLTTKVPLRDQHGALVGLVGISHDITDRKRAETERDQLLEREKAARLEAEAANRAKSEFLANMS